MRHLQQKASEGKDRLKQAREPGGGGGAGGEAGDVSGDGGDVGLDKMSQGVLL